MEDILLSTFNDCKEEVGFKREFALTPLEKAFSPLYYELTSKPFQTSYYAIFFITEGSGVHEINFKEYKTKAGDAVFLTKGSVHKFVKTNSMKGYVITMGEEFIYKSLRTDAVEAIELFNQLSMSPVKSFITVDNPIILNQLKLIETILYDDSWELERGLIYSILKTLTLLLKKICLPNTGSKHENNEIFLEFTKLVSEKLNSIKTVDKYAEMMHVSKKTVNLMTRKAVDMSAKQYIIQQIIYRMKLNLCFENKTVDEISYDLGFSKASNMTLFFKKYTGLTPSKFRSLNS